MPWIIDAAWRSERPYHYFISLPATARLLADVLGAMIYTRQNFVMIDNLPESTQTAIHKHIP